MREPTNNLNIFCCPTRGLMKAVDFSEHSGQIYQSTRCPTPEKSNIQPPGEPKILICMHYLLIITIILIVFVKSKE
jgi:hypothetical protein